MEEEEKIFEIMNSTIQVEQVFLINNWEESSFQKIKENN
jgi:hypothetical protein